MALLSILVFFVALKLFTTNASEQLKEEMNFHTDAHLELKQKRELAKQYLEDLNNMEENWIDPYDIIGESNMLNAENSFPSCDTKCTSNAIYLMRWLKMIQSKIETESKPISIVVPLSSQIQEILKSDAVLHLEIADIDEIISNLIDNSVVQSEKDIDWSLYNLSIHACGVLFVTFSLFLVYKFVLSRPFLSVLCVIVLASVSWHWMHLYHKRIAHKQSEMSMIVPSECQAKDLTLSQHFYAYMKGFFVKTDCVKYYEAVMVDPIWEVSLTVAFSDAVAAMIFQPLYTISKVLNGSFKLLYDDLSIFACIILTMFLFLLIIMTFKYTMKFPFFMGSIEPGKHNYVQEVNPVKNQCIKNISKFVYKNSNCENNEKSEDNFCCQDSAESKSLPLSIETDSRAIDKKGNKDEEDQRSKVDENLKDYKKENNEIPETDGTVCQITDIKKEMESNLL